MKFAGDRLRLSASDVANFVACQHLTRLDLLEARGALRRAREFDLGFEDLVTRGEAHELTVLERFRADGRSIAEIARGRTPSAEAAQATREAIRGGADVIYQGVLLGTSADGRDGAAGATGLPGPRRPAPQPRTGSRARTSSHYEVVDAKLARTAKARAVAQTAFYSHLLAALQGVRPRWMHLALGRGDLTSAQGRRLRGLRAAGPARPGRVHRRRPGRQPADRSVPGAGGALRDLPLGRPVQGPQAARRRPVAGRRDHQGPAADAEDSRGFDQARAGIPGRPSRPERASRRSLEGARLQARLQVASEDEGRIRYELLDPERDLAGELLTNRGLLALPVPVTGDLFFDIEGARYYSEDGKEFGLQYLFGIVDTADTDASGRPRYTQIWAFDRPDEKRAFEELVDFITERRRRHPGLHVYHYNHYEPTSVDHLTELHGTRQEAVGRLMGRFATREDEVDDLFRRGVFVDLYRVVRQGVRAGVESYSIKRLEPLVGYTRQMDLRQATENLIAFEAALEDQTAAGRRGDDNGSSPPTTRTTAGPRWRCATGWSSGGPNWPGGWARSCPGPPP